jgi:arylsulfatase A-like enzyme
MNHSIQKFLFLFVGIFLFQHLQAQQPEKKNLLFIITDQQRYDALGYAGNTVIKTPNLDRLAEQGAYFRNAYTPCAVCGPARSSILTGYTVEGTGVKSNNETYYYDETEVMTMPTFDEILAQNGYRTEYYGKWHALSARADVYENPLQIAENGSYVFGGPGGQSLFWKEYLSGVGPAPGPVEGEFVDGMSKWPYSVNPLDRFFGYTWEELQNQGLSHVQPDQHGKLQLDKEHTLTAFQGRQTLEAIERLKDSTFSITCSFHFPHSPMLAPEPWYGMYPVEDMIPPVSINDDMQNSPYVRSNSRQHRTEYADPDKIKYMISEYYGLVSEIDHYVGQILDKLDSLGIADKTMVIFVSDHGEMLGAHGMREKNVFYEESAHIPLLIRNPGDIAPATTVDGYVSLIDLYPTILDYLDVSGPASEGKSLRGLIEGTDTVHGQYVVTEWDRENNPNYMVVKGGWKLFIPYTIKSNVINAMYDLNTDPHEMNNLLGSNPDREQYLDKAEELRACLLEWLAEKNSMHYYSVSQRDLLNGGRATGNNADFVSQEVPELEAGETVTVSITMKNSGTTAWTPRGQFRLGSQGPADNDRWGLTRVHLAEGDSIVPGAEKTFTFDVTVPDADGLFNFQWQMVQDGEEWFGEKSELKQVISGNPGSFLDDCDASTDWKSSAGLSVNSADQQQGNGCIEFSAGSTDEFKKVFSPAYNSFGTEANTELRFWYYVSDVTKLGSNNQVELGSAGSPDQDEYNWSLSGLTNGWNYLTLKTREANKMGSPDLGAINWFRIYRFKDGPVTTRIDAIQLIDTEVGPLYTLLVNDGTGDGNYPEGHQVGIEANNAPAGMQFDQWTITSGDPVFGDVNAASTTLTMGAGPAVVEATYREKVAEVELTEMNDVLKIYPNPAQSEITIELGLNQAAEVGVSLLDLSGRAVGSRITDHFVDPGRTMLQLPLQGVTPGTYILKARIDGSLHTELLVIR